MNTGIKYVLILISLATVIFGQVNPGAGVVLPVTAPREPLPSEAASAGVTRYSYIVYGDQRGRNDGTELQYEHRLVVNGMLAAIKRLASTPYPVRWILSSGDSVQDGTNPAQWNVSYVPLANRLTTEGGVPVFVAPGNHELTGSADLSNPRRLAGLRNFLNAFSNIIPPDSDPRRLAEYPTYAFGYGNTFVLALDTNIASDPAQLAWAEQQLEKVDRTRYTHLIVDFHHPVFSSGPHGGPHVEAPTAALREKYMPLFRKYHVTALFVGHEHLFEHWVERYSDATGRHRMDEIVSGGGGAPLYSYLGEPDLSDYMMSNSVTVEHLVKPDVNPGANPYHFVIVTVDGDRMGVEVVGVDFGSRFQPYRNNKMDLAGPGGGN